MAILWTLGVMWLMYDYLSNFYADCMIRLSIKPFTKHWRLLTILKTSNKSVWSNVFRFVKVYIFWKFTQYAKQWDKKISYGQKKRYKSALFFLSFAPIITVLLLIHNSYTSGSTRFICLKLSVRFSIFDSVLDFIKSLYFCSTKSMDTLTLKRYNSTQNKNNRKATRSFAPRPMISVWVGAPKKPTRRRTFRT